MSILFLDDDPLSLKMYSRITDLAGYRSITTTDAEEAIKLATTQPLALMFTDFQMPKMDGLAVIQALRAQEITKNLPVYMLSGSTSTDLHERVIQAGGQGYLRKPVRLEALLNIISTNLTRKL